MTYLSPDPRPIPPEMPSDPSRVPTPTPPIHTPPEKGPGRPEPIPPGPVGPTPMLRAAAALALVLALTAAPAHAQRTVGKDTTTLEHANPMQAECSQIGNAEERARCIQKHQQQSGAAGNSKPEEARERQTQPSVGREQVLSPSGTPPKSDDANTETSSTPPTPARNSR